MTDKLQNVMKKPKALWDGAVQAVKGPGVETLVEDFTAEMTLVAEGLCEDQQRLRGQVEAARKDLESLSRQESQAMNDLTARLDEIQRGMDTYHEETNKRLRALETAKPKGFVKANGLVGQLTVLAAVLGGSWVLVTLLNLFK